MLKKLIAIRDYVGCIIHIETYLTFQTETLCVQETLMDLEEVEEEKSIASASLDLPMFLHHTRAPLFP